MSCESQYRCPLCPKKAPIGSETLDQLNRQFARSGSTLSDACRTEIMLAIGAAVNVDRYQPRKKRKVRS